MGKWVDTRESDIEDLLWNGIDYILGEIAQFLDEESGAFDGASNYKTTVRGRLHKRLHDQIWPDIDRQLRYLEQEINECVDTEVDKAINAENAVFDHMENMNSLAIAELKEKIEELEEENRLFREGKAGMVHGKQYGI